MIRGALVGTLTLIVLYAIVQEGSSTRLASGSNLLLSGLRRFLSGDVAGVPQRGAASGAATGVHAGSKTVTDQTHPRPAMGD